MKMTPEQKAFYEYGELFQLWKDARRCVFWHEESHEDIRREIVQKVWRKRAACRDWVTVPPANRNCENCANSVVKPIPEVCKICMMPKLSDWKPIKWDK